MAGKLLNKGTYWLALLCLVLLPVANAHAQGDESLKTVAVVSVASVDELMGDIGYLMEAAGVPEFGNMAVLLSAPFTVGLDKTKPSGMVLRTDGVEFDPLGFIPVTNLQQVLLALQEQIGEPQDAGDGVLELADAPEPIYIKEQGGWAFIAQSKEALAHVPDDPVALLGGLDSEYEIGVRAYVHNIPAQMRQTAIDWIQSGAQQQLENVPVEDDQQAEIQKKLVDNGLQQFQVLIDETDTVTVGWKIDAEAKTTYLDFAMTAVPDTTLARRMEALAETTSQHTGFIQPDAAVTVHFSQTMTQEDIDQTLPVLATIKARALEELDHDEELSDDVVARSAAKKALGSLFDVIESTIEAGKLDGGAVLVLEPRSVAFVAGGYVANGADLEELFKRLVELGASDEDFPEVQWDADEHGDVRMHTMTVPVDDEEAQDVLGEDVEVAVGIGESSGYIAFGNDSISLLKKVIDGSAAGADKEVPPVQLIVALEPILKFIESVDQEGTPAIALMREALEQAEGKDHLSFRSIPIENGAITRVEIEEGVLRAISEAIQSGMAAGGIPGGFGGPEAGAADDLFPDGF